jgi:hypothetical protein
MLPCVSFAKERTHPECKRTAMSEDRGRCRLKAAFRRESGTPLSGGSGIRRPEAGPLLLSADLRFSVGVDIAERYEKT